MFVQLVFYLPNPILRFRIHVEAVFEFTSGTSQMVCQFGDLRLQLLLFVTASVGLFQFSRKLPEFALMLVNCGGLEGDIVCQ